MDRQRWLPTYRCQLWPGWLIGELLGSGIGGPDGATCAIDYGIRNETSWEEEGLEGSGPSRLFGRWLGCVDVQMFRCPDVQMSRFVGLGPSGLGGLAAGCGRIEGAGTSCWHSWCLVGPASHGTRARTEYGVWSTYPREMDMLRARYSVLRTPYSVRVVENSKLQSRVCEMNMRPRRIAATVALKKEWISYHRIRGIKM